MSEATACPGVIDATTMPCLLVMYGVVPLDGSDAGAVCTGVARLGRRKKFAACDSLIAGIRGVPGAIMEVIVGAASVGGWTDDGDTASGAS